MPSPTYVALAKATPTSGYSLTITNIPQTYTDLLVVISGRNNLAAWDDNAENRLNSSATTYTSTVLATNNNGTAVNVYSSSESMNTFYGLTLAGASNTSNTFASIEYYIPNYTSSQQKIVSITGVVEANAQYRGLIQTRAVLWSQTAAVSSIYFVGNGEFIAGTRIDIYGIKNS